MLELIRPGSVIIFCENPELSASWWASLCGAELLDEQGFWWFMIGEVEFGFHPADEAKNPKGASTVPYWIVPNLSDAVDLVKKSGGEHLRGPLRTDESRIIAQVRDPYGLVLGLEERS